MLDLRGRRFVCLSACAIARPTDLRLLDEALHLTSGFLRAARGQRLHLDHPGGTSLTPGAVAAGGFRVACRAGLITATLLAAFTPDPGRVTRPVRHEYLPNGPWWDESLRQRAVIDPHSPVPVLDKLLAPFRAGPAGHPAQRHDSCAP